MGKFNTEQRTVSDSHRPLTTLLRSGRADESDRVLADIEIRSQNGRWEVMFTPKAVVSISTYSNNPVRFNPASFASSLRDKGYAKIKDVAYAGGTAPIVVTQDGSSYLLTVRRDEKAPTNPNTLDSLVGRGNSIDPLVSLVGEAVEEVLFLDGKGRVVMPQFSQTGLKAYNGHIHKTINKLSKRLASDREEEVGKVHADVCTRRIKDPFYLNGIPVGIGFSPLNDWSRGASIIDIMLPPYLMGKIPIAGFKETIEYETEGMVPERQVVLIKIQNGSDHSPMVMSYRNGEKMDDYDSLEDYSKSVGINPKMPFAPSTATMVHHLGIDFGYGYNGYMRPLAALLREKD